jgi:membrane-bound ClpP family serine protease
MNYEALALLLMVVGFALIVAEVFIPSGGMILILCVIAFVASIWCAYKAWWGVSDGFFWTYVASLIVLIPGAVIGAFRFLENSSVGDRMLLGAPRLEDVTPHQQETQRLTALVGRRGFALTLMAPGGMVSIDGERLHAVSEGTFVEQGSPIEIIGLRGTRVVVRSVDQHDTAGARPRADDQLAQTERPSDAPPPLDFDLPQG